jgi:hypothetical protein
MLFDFDAVGLEGGAQDIDRAMGFRFAAHEDIHRGVGVLGPAVDADMGLCKHRDSGNAAVLGEMMQVDMQQGCTRGVNAVAQCRFDKLQIVEPLCTP